MALRFAPKMERKIILGLMLIILAGTVLRMYDSTTESLWTDEAFVLHHAEQQTIDGVVQAVVEREAAPPFYYVLMHFWIALVGTSEFSLRMPSVLFGIASIVMLFLVARRLFDDKTALLAAAFMSISAMHVVYAQEARLYLMFTFLVICSTYAFLRINEKKWMAVYFFVMTIAIYTNYIALLVLGIHGVWLIVEKKFNKRWLLVSCSVLVAALPLLPIVIAQFFGRNNGLAETLVSRGVPQVLANFGIFFFALPPILALGGIFMIARKVKISDSLFGIMIAVFSLSYVYLALRPLTVFGITLTQPLITSYFLVRHSLFLAPIIHVYFAHRIMQMDTRKLQALCIGLLILSNMITLSFYYSKPTKTQWREAVEFIERNMNRQDVQTVLLDTGGESNQKLLAYYTSKPYRAVPLTEHTRKKFVQMDAVELQRTIEHEEEFFLILANNPLTKDQYKDMLDARYVRVDSVELNEIRVFYYRQPVRD